MEARPAGFEPATLGLEVPEDPCRTVSENDIPLRIRRSARQCTAGRCRSSSQPTGAFGPTLDPPSTPDARPSCQRAAHRAPSRRGHCRPPRGVPAVAPGCAQRCVLPPRSPGVHVLCCARWRAIGRAFERPTGYHACPPAGEPDRLPVVATLDFSGRLSSSAVAATMTPAWSAGFLENGAGGRRPVSRSGGR